jgi:hypothetical protein|uniref:EF-hand domain-containing protein n=1 Tax=Globisporangium ultimum (strain ATCC 200006 / CBS 805.95 / DAOM BR144) TaxID=431595 RepID=K3WAK5_GLOUD
MATGGCSNGIKTLSLAERLQNFRGQIRLELPDVGDASVRLQIIVSGTSYLLRYQVESIGAEVSVFNKAGSMTSWITTSNARTIQLRTFLNADGSPRSECKQIASLLDILEILDLFDVFRASLSAVVVAPAANPQQDANQEIFCATSDKNSYVFAFDSATGCPLTVTQSAVVESAASSITAQFSKLRMIVEDYMRFKDGSIDIPHGIKSDVELMIDTAMTCFSQWSFKSQQRIMELFDLIDKDGDGCISSEDVYDQLVFAGQSEHQSTSIAVEMSRLLCDASNPSEEFQFYKFCGFWITMLADGYRVSDPANEATVPMAFENLFLGGGGATSI